MKKVIIALVLLEFLLLLAGCRPQQAAIPARDSWDLFCTSRGYDPADRSRQVYDQYLDTWLGSAEEEQALANTTK